MLSKLVHTHGDKLGSYEHRVDEVINFYAPLFGYCRGDYVGCYKEYAYGTVPSSIYGWEYGISAYATANGRIPIRFSHEKYR